MMSGSGPMMRSFEAIVSNTTCTQKLEMVLLFLSRLCLPYSSSNAGTGAGRVISFKDVFCSQRNEEWLKGVTTAKETCDAQELDENP
ncbi:unnamed protein product [Gongylonema pulchrum]|uniref:Secreted protein n=1 Tax=Gongylonema pulchrum TaxID=637853 RepID=A0A183DKY6_9BILA|nr:unnamed protein product [Gongylonema pulchrum]